MKNDENRVSKNQQIKKRLDARLSYWNLNNNQIKQPSEVFHKSKTQTMHNEDLTEENKENNDQIRIIKLDESDGVLNGNYIMQQK